MIAVGRSGDACADRGVVLCQMEGSGIACPAVGQCLACCIRHLVLDAYAWGGGEDMHAIGLVTANAWSFEHFGREVGSDFRHTNRPSGLVDGET